MTVDVIERTSEKTEPSAPRSGWLAGLGVAGGLGALAASSCCVLPLALAGLGATGVIFVGLNILANLRPFLLGGGAVALAAGWLLHIRRSLAPFNVDGVCPMPASRNGNLALLTLGTALVGLAFAWGPYVEPILFGFVR